tara:strand:- start:6504 stop:7040 length:537 start_codon:yes stop_codon:yes gene_type:complete
MYKSKKKMNSKYGLVFWMEGYSGSGKSTIMKLIHSKIEKRYGPTINISGDDLRKLYNLNGYKKKDRIKNSYQFSEILKFLSEKQINVLYTVVGLNHKARKIYKTKLKNFIVTYIDANIKEIIKLGKKKTYKNKKNILGIDIVPEYPKNPDFIIKNDMKTNLKSLASNYFADIKKSIYK